jgi:hypothetical protein
MFNFSDLVTDEALEATRKDFEDETVLVIKNSSGNLSNSDDRLLKKINQVKKKKEEKIRTTSNLQMYLGGLAGLIETLLKSIKIASVALLISLVWLLLQLRKKLLEENVRLMERAKFENNPGGDKLRTYFRTQWNNSVGNLDFLAAIIIMTIFYRINRSLYRDTFELYQEGVREYMESRSKYATFKQVYKSARESARTS